ncbi:MAG: hypothetical protein HKP58_07935 [Desulfatitalea sp.]|nr:hypothetical protein [Desulfatitalea sp.]NNK00330.1 hypothetical protein [Desulfatitalea sp.]
MKYTCTQYREEMVLLGLKRRLSEPALNTEERKRIEKEIKKLEAQMGMD